MRWRLQRIARFSVDYLGPEIKAKTAGRGVHWHECKVPWKYNTRLKGQDDEMTTRFTLGLAVALSFCSGLTVAQSANVVDGDTIRVGGKTYDIWGIDAAEPEQLCGSWPAGHEATEHLKQLVSGKSVICEPKATDRFGNTLARCTADKVDIGEAMVRNGYAWAFVDYTTDYVDEEKLAFELNLGVHHHGCERPWEYRERVKAK